MSIQSFQQKLKTIAVKDLKEALDKMLQGIKDSSSVHTDGLNLLGQYILLQREKNIGIISSEQADLRFRQLLNNFLQLVEEIEDADKMTVVQRHIYYIGHTDQPIVLNLETLEQEGLHRQVELIIKKLNKLKEALLLSTDASVQFKYEEEIFGLEEQLRKLRK